MTSIVERASSLAKKWHGDQQIKSIGNEHNYYKEHLAQVRDLLKKIGFSEMTQAVGVLHDVLEDTKIGVWKLRREMGNDVTEKVKKVTESKKLKRREMTKEEIKHSIRTRYFQNIITDYDALAVSLADQINNSERCLRQPPTVEKYQTSEWMATQIRKYKREIDLCKNFSFVQKDNKLKILYGLLGRNVTELIKKYGAGITSQQLKAA